MKRGHFIVLEGLDGSGKSTHAKLLAEHLNASGRPTLLTCEPTTGDVGKLIRCILGSRSEVTRESLVQLFAADRVDHIKRTMLPALESGKNVICDRYVFSSCAYQSEFADTETILRANERAMELLPADGVIYLQLPPEECLKRIAETRGMREIYEELPALKRTEKGYEEAFAHFPKEKLRRVDASTPMNETAAAVLAAYLELTEE